jgi:hypothetical protein
MFAFPGVEPSAFALFVQILYTGRLPSRSASSQKEYTTLCKLYALSTALRDATTKEIAITAILARAKEGNDIPSSEHV